MIKQNKMIHVWVSADFKAELNRLSRKYKLSTSEFIRKCVEENYKTVIKTQKEKITTDGYEVGK